jgi:hypothetical protein
VLNRDVKGINLDCMTISLDEKQLKSKPKKVGTLKGKPVFAIQTKGGLSLVADSAGHILSCGPHRAIARNIAEKSEPTIEWTDLEKSGYIDPASYEFLLPKYTELTNALRKMQGE